MLAWLIELGLWPAVLPLSSSIILIISSVFTAALTAAFGLGGGVIMLALLVNFIPVAMVIPVHGVVQVASNCTRALLLRREIVWQIVCFYFLGALLGALVAGQFVVVLPEAILLLVLAIFILFLVWGPKIKQFKQGRFTHTIAGGLITFSTMFIGATGPLAMALLPRKQMFTRQVSATHASLMIIQHGLKIILFGWLGFNFSQWGLFLTGMILSGILGNFLGRIILNKLEARYFQSIITIILTILAIKMLVDGLLQIL